MSASLLAAWKKNIFSSPFQARCEGEEESQEPVETLSVNEERSIAAADSSGNYKCLQIIFLYNMK